MNKKLWRVVGRCIVCLTDKEQKKSLVFFTFPKNDCYHLPETNDIGIDEQDFRRLKKESEKLRFLNEQGAQQTLFAAKVKDEFTRMLKNYGIHVRREDLQTVKMYLKDDEQAEFYFCIFVDKIESELVGKATLIGFDRISNLTTRNFAWSDDLAAVRYFLHNTAMFFPGFQKSLCVSH
jgi:hypothetical protein